MSKVVGRVGGGSNKSALKGRKKLPKSDPLVRAACNKRNEKRRVLENDEAKASRSADVYRFSHKTKEGRKEGFGEAHLECLLSSKAESTSADERDGSESRQ